MVQRNTIQQMCNKLTYYSRLIVGYNLQTSINANSLY